MPILSEHRDPGAVAGKPDADWADHGHLDRAVDLIRIVVLRADHPGCPCPSIDSRDARRWWCARSPRTSGAEDARRCCCTGIWTSSPRWRAGDDLGPWKPVLEGDRLYGRGGADDGYWRSRRSARSRRCRAAGGAHPRCVLLMEGSEEPGSPDLPAYIDELADVIGTLN
ncbi:MAG: hypothetical protein R2697_09705 [Ilumatobacteraceae bacterium]